MIFLPGQDNLRPPAYPEEMTGSMGEASKVVADSIMEASKIAGTMGEVTLARVWAMVVASLPRHSPPQSRYYKLPILHNRWF